MCWVIRYWLALLDSRCSLPIYLSMFVRTFSPLKTAATVGQPAATWRNLQYGQTASVRIIYFPAHCASVTNMSPRDNLSQL